MKRWLAVSLLFCGSAAAAPVSVLWTTYLYAVPGRPSAVLDQVDRGTLANTLGCEQGWCRVRIGGVEGFVAQEVLGTQTDKPVSGEAGPCIEIGLVSFNSLRPAVVCPVGGSAR